MKLKKENEPVFWKKLAKIVGTSKGTIYKYAYLWHNK